MDAVEVRALDGAQEFRLRLPENNAFVSRCMACRTKSDHGGSTHKAVSKLCNYYGFLIRLPL